MYRLLSRELVSHWETTEQEFEWILHASQNTTLQELKYIQLFCFFIKLKLPFILVANMLESHRHSPASDCVDASPKKKACKRCHSNFQSISFKYTSKSVPMFKWNIWIINYHKFVNFIVIDIIITCETTRTKVCSFTFIIINCSSFSWPRIIFGDVKKEEKIHVVKPHEPAVIQCKLHEVGDDLIWIHPGSHTDHNLSNFSAIFCTVQLKSMIMIAPHGASDNSHLWVHALFKSYIDSACVQGCVVTMRRGTVQ